MLFAVLSWQAQKVSIIFWISYLEYTTLYGLQSAKYISPYQSSARRFALRHCWIITLTLQKVSCQLQKVQTHLHTYNSNTVSICESRSCSLCSGWWTLDIEYNKSNTKYYPLQTPMPWDLSSRWLRIQSSDITWNNTTWCENIYCQQTTFNILFTIPIVQYNFNDNQRGLNSHSLAYQYICLYM